LKINAYNKTKLIIQETKVKNPNNVLKKEIKSIPNITS